MITALIEFFKSCPQLLGKELNVNYLGYRDGDCSIDQLGEFSKIKSYCDGGGVYSRDFAICVRCGWDENAPLNKRDAEFLEAIALWITQQNAIGNLPYLGEGCQAVAIGIKTMPYLAESSVQGGRMHLEFTLKYREN